MAQAEEIRTETGPLDYDYTEKEVELCQENLQNHKACSPDKIKNEMLKLLGKIFGQCIIFSCQLGAKPYSQSGSALGSRAAQSDYLKLLARDFKKLSDHDERLQPHLSLPNSPPIEVCQEAFCLVYGNGQGGLSLPHFKKCVRERFGPEIISSRKQRQKPSFDLCAKFFSDIMMLCSRVSRDKLGRPIYHLSYGTEWRKMYEDRFVPWLLSIIQELTFRVSQSFMQFMRIQIILFITFICQVKTKTPEKKKSAIEARDLHDKMVDIDHAWYIMDKAFCERHPDKKSCIAVDQTTLEQGIPSHHPPKKLFDRKNKLEVNFGGGINFSISQENHIKYFFVYFSHFTKDANLVLTQLFFMIWVQLTSDFAASRSAELRIHVDNTAAENKNQWLFSFAGWLLLLLLFKKVFLSFLPVGHTGNEVDSSVFGSVKDKCKVSDIVCLFDIFKVAKDVLDFRSFFQPHLLGIQRTMEDGSRFPVVRGKKYLNELAEFGEWIHFMDGNPQGMPKPAPPTLDILPDNVKKTLKKLLRHPLLIKGEDRREWIENFLATGGKDDGVRVIGEHETGMVGRPGQLKIGALTVDIHVVEASSLPPLNLIEAADQRITVADEAYKSMLAADDGGRLHMKLIPSSTKTFKNIRTNDQSENQSADPECLPVSASVRESQLEKVVEGMHASMLALASKQEALQQEFESREHEFERKLTEQKKILEARVSEEEQKRRVLAHKYHQLKEAFSNRKTQLLLPNRHLQIPILPQQPSRPRIYQIKDRLQPSAGNSLRLIIISVPSSSSPPYPGRMTPELMPSELMATRPWQCIVLPFEILSLHSYLTVCHYHIFVIIADHSQAPGSWMMMAGHCHYDLRLESSVGTRPGAPEQFQTVLAVTV
eukprot:g52101.t1